MLASQVILSNLQIPYPQVPGGADPQKTINDFTGALLYAYGALGDPVYQSPATLPLPVTLPGLVLTSDQIAAGITMQQAIQQLALSDISLFSPPVVAAQTAAVVAYQALTPSGNLTAIHAAIDAINALAPLTKQPIFCAYPDITYLRCAAGVVGIVAQRCGGPDGDLFFYGHDPVTDKIVADAMAGTGPSSMQPTAFWEVSNA